MDFIFFFIFLSLFFLLKLVHGLLNFLLLDLDLAFLEELFGFFFLLDVFQILHQKFFPLVCTGLCIEMQPFGRSEARVSLHKLLECLRRNEFISLKILNDLRFLRGLGRGEAGLGSTLDGLVGLVGLLRKS